VTVAVLSLAGLPLMEDGAMAQQLLQACIQVVCSHD